MSSFRWLAEHVVDGKTWFRIGRSDDAFVAEWVGTARLVAKRDGTHSFSSESDACAAVVEKIRRGSARLLLRHIEGKLALHGACVGLGGRAVILLGRSGYGKSTLAASLCVNGTALFADDAVAVEEREGGYEVLPGEGKHWLEPSAVRALEGGADSNREVRDLSGGAIENGVEKTALPSKNIGTSSAALLAMVDLSFREDVEVPRLVRVEAAVSAMASLVPQVARFVLDDSSVQRRELEVLGELVSRVPMYRLERRRDLADLPHTTSLVLDLLRT